MQHHWPGNIRELENVIQRGLVLSHGEVITIDHLPSYLQPHDQPSAPAGPPTPPEGQGIPLRQLMEAYEKQLLTKALQQCGWNRSRAASLLGINRRQLFSKIKRYGLG